MFRKTILLIVLFLIGFAIGNTAKAADVNGYTAKYECIAGGTNCDVDVAALTSAACQQTINTTDAWSTINWAADVICLTTGDHSAKGRLDLGSSGTSGTRKVLRMPTGSDDDPWDQTAGNRAKIYALATNAQDYWIIHRITIDGDYGSSYGLWIDDGSDNNIISRVLIEQADNDLIYVYRAGATGTPDSNTIQNSVIRDTKVSNTLENDCITISDATNTHIVNNEIYGCNKMIFTQERQDSSGLVVENNDLYEDSADYTNCSGGAGTTCGIAEALISLKDGADTSANPVQIIQNRIWGAREVDPTIGQPSISTCISVSAGGTAGIQPSDGNGASYVLFKNNICFDSELGINNYWNGPQYNSFIGNIFWDINRTHNLYEEYVEQGAISYWRLDKSEFYLNTIIGSEQWLWTASSTADYHDYRCNVMIDSGAKTGSDNGNTQYDYNVYYGTTSSGETNKLGNYTLNTRANSTAYSLGAIIRTTATPPQDGTAGDFLYIVTTAGTSAGSPPSYTTTLGGTTTDGTMVVKAIRGPYSFWRKLRTTADQVFIPYAKVHNSAPEYNYCPNTTGNRASIGISDQTGTW